MLNKITYVNGAQIVGSLAPITTAAAEDFTVTEGVGIEVLALEGYCNGTTSLITVSEANLIAANIKSGVTIFGILGTYTGA